MTPTPPTWIEIDLEAIRSNFQQIVDFVSPCTVIPIVKADGYGHGAIAVARALCEAGAGFFGVASVDEAAELKASGIDAPILILGPLLGREVGKAVGEGFRITAFRDDMVSEISRAAAKHRTRALVHAKIDTGMGRIGVPLAEAVSFAQVLRSSRGITLEGIFTHFASADSDEEFTRQQLTGFKRLLSELTATGVEVPTAHAANSAAIFRFPDSHLQAVRPGLAIYGLTQTLEPPPIKLKPALTLRTTVAMLKAVPAGFPVSYGRTYETSRPTTLATLPVGYRHGIPWALSNMGEVLIRGQRAPIVGTVCMDQMVVDVGEVRGAAMGDVVTVYGSEGGERIGVEEVAGKAGTISYEILCALDKKVPRIYLPPEAPR